MRCLITSVATNIEQFKVQRTLILRYSSIGGLWNFTGKDGIEEDGIERHSSMYYNMRTNNSKYVMETPEFSLSDPNETRCFVDVPFVLHKMQQFAEEHGILNLIQFCSWVDHVSYNNESENFSVTVKNLKTQERALRFIRYLYLFNTPESRIVLLISFFSQFKYRNEQLFSW